MFFSADNMYKGEIQRFLWITNFEWSINEQGLLVHEVYHLCMSVLENIGIEYCEKSEEAYAYYLQHIYSQCLAVLRPKKKKNYLTKKNL